MTLVTKRVSAFHRAINFRRRSYSSIMSPSTASDKWSLQSHLKNRSAQRGGVDIRFMPFLPPTQFLEPASTCHCEAHGIPPALSYLLASVDIIFYPGLRAFQLSLPSSISDSPSLPGAPVSCARN